MKSSTESTTPTPIEPQAPAPLPSQPNNRMLVIGAGLLIVVTIALGMFLNSRTAKPPVTPQQDKQAIIRITPTGFVPQQLNVEPGTTVTWVNEDSKVHYIESNPYPEATEHPGLNSQQAINTGSTYSYTVSEPGEYNYHDRLNPQVNGRVVAQ